MVLGNGVKFIFSIFFYAFTLHLADKRPEDANYMVYVLTRCVVNKEVGSKKTMKIVPLNERGEPAVVSLPLCQVIIIFFFFEFKFIVCCSLFFNNCGENIISSGISFFFFQVFF